MTHASGGRIVALVSDPSTAEPAERGRIDRVRSRAVATAETALATLEGARRKSRAVDAAVRTYERDRDSVGSVLAGAVAFRLFAFLLPLTLGLVTLLGALQAVDESGPADVSRELGMSAYLIESVETAARDSHNALWVLVPVSLWAVYTGGRGIVKVLRAVHAIAWSQPRTRPPNGLVAALAAVGLGFATVAVLALLQAARAHGPGYGVVALGGFVPFALLWLATSLALPRDPRAGWTALLPGAILMGVAVWLAHFLSVYFLAHQVDRASELYGSLGVAAALLAWLYIVSRLMVASAMLNATRWEQRTGPPPAPAPERS
jgi:uncharacterized BrkB/YihY/UPF0761 family membrane protein